MAPGKTGKKPRGRKKKKKTRRPLSPTVPAGLVEALEARLRSVAAELEQERQQKMYFQMERDKITTAYEACRKELEAKTMELRNKQRDMEFLDKRHQEEIKQFREKIQMLQFEHNNSIQTLKSYSEKSITMLTEQFRTREAELKEDRRTLEQRIMDMENAHNTLMGRTKEEHDREMEKLRREFEEPVLLGVFRGSGGGGPGCWEFMRRKTEGIGPDGSKVRPILPPRRKVGEEEESLFETRVVPKPRRPDGGGTSLALTNSSGSLLTHRPSARSQPQASPLRKRPLSAQPSMSSRTM